jgi:hypothetical protein
MCHAAEDKLENTTLERSKVRRAERGFLTDYSPRPLVSLSQTFPFWLLGLEPSMVSTLHFSGIRNAEALRILATINGAPNPLITKVVQGCHLRWAQQDPIQLEGKSR